jgi:DNA-binding MarR family transcriptional regulator
MKNRPRAAARRDGKNLALTDPDWAILDVLARDPHASNREIAGNLKIPI